MKNTGNRQTIDLNEVVIFGAGNIGRSFIGNIFASNGFHLVFVDANRDLVDELNRKKEYRIVIKKNNVPDREVLVRNFTAVHSSDRAAVLDRLVSCRLCVTSVGQGALPKVIPLLAEAVQERKKHTSFPLDIIIAENIRNGAEYFRQVLTADGTEGIEAGLVETSIGKMVPIMKEEDLRKDPLALYAEEYNTLILDKKGFKNSVPEFPEVKVVDNISAWVDRKLFIHNLGHVSAAYLGFRRDPRIELIADLLKDVSLREQVRQVMLQAAAALLKEYPTDFTKQDLREHIEDLLFRFQNRALGDTVFRVGRDLRRKLGREDRILGAARLCIKHGLPYEEIITVFLSAFHFRAGDQHGRLFEGDRKFFTESEKIGYRRTLVEICGLDPLGDEVLLQEIMKNEAN